MKAILMALSAPLIGTVGQVLLKIGMTRVTAACHEKGLGPVGLFMAAIMNPWIMVAIPLYFIGFFIWLLVLSKLDLSYAYPFLALAYVLVPVASWLILGEVIPPLRWLGIAVICVGIIMIGLAK